MVAELEQLDPAGARFITTLATAALRRPGVWVRYVERFGPGLPADLAAAEAWLAVRLDR